MDIQHALVIIHVMDTNVPVIIRVMKIQTGDVSIIAIFLVMLFLVPVITHVMDILLAPAIILVIVTVHAHVTTPVMATKHALHAIMLYMENKQCKINVQPELLLSKIPLSNLSSILLHPILVHG